MLFVSLGPTTRAALVAVAVVMGTGPVTNMWLAVQHGNDRYDDFVR